MSRRRQIQVAALGLFTIVAIAAGMRFFTAESVPVLNPIYQIETTSNGFKGSLLNLRMGQPGIPQVPTPVDVDGDLLPDILVAVNLVDVSGLVNNPPNPGAILAPNVEITRDPTAAARCLPLVLTNKCNPPLKVQVKLTVADSSNLKTDQVISFGYDTGNNGAAPTNPDDQSRIGSIPTYFKATLRGLENFFNPLTADISTRGAAITGQLTNNLELNRVVNSYEGPLDIVGSIGNANGILSTEGGLLKKLTTLLNTPVDKTADLRLGYRPWPGNVSVTYGSDSAGNHITYQHDRKDEVDLNARLVQFNRTGNAADSSVFEARIDRLPRKATLDFQTGDKAGNVRFTASPDGRLPDVHVSALSEKVDILTKTQVTASVALKARLDARLLGAQVSAQASLYLGLGEETVDLAFVPKEPPLIVDADVEALPPILAGNWSFPSGGPASALFCAGQVSGSPAACDPAAQGIGAVEANVRTFYGQPIKLGPSVPEQQQFLSFENAQGGALGPETRISARIDRIREASFAETNTGFTATTRAGDGELPLFLNVVNDDRTATDGLTIKATATVSPLPDALTATLTKPGTNQKTDPLKLTYDTSKSVDVTSTVDLKLPGAGPVCGQANTVCGTLAVRHIPAHIETRVGTFTSVTPDIGNGATAFPETRVEIDAVPRAGGAPPDFFADVTTGVDINKTPTDFSDDMPIVAHGELLAFPKFTRIRFKQGPNGSIDRLEFHACDWDYDATAPACSAATTADRIGSVSATVRNWLTRPADLPILVPATPIYATLAARGVDNSDDIRFEANAKLTDIGELQVRNTGKTFGLLTKVGGSKDLSATVDAGNLQFPGANPADGRFDLVGQTLVSPLPGSWSFCFRQSDQTLETLTDSFTDDCENKNPFGDTANLAKSPLSLAYHADAPFTVSAELSMLQRGATAATADDHRYRATVDVQNLPKDLVAHVQAPPKDTDGPIRVIYRGPSNGTPMAIDARAESLDGDLTCADPRTPPLGKKALCAEGRIENLPQRALVVYDPTKRVDNLLVDTDSQINLVGIPQLDPSLPERKFTVSMVEGKRKSDDNTSPDFNTVIPDILVAEAKVTGLPKKVTGTIDLPGAVEINAEPAVGAVDATVRNFIVPDPMPKSEPLREIRPGFTVDPADANIQKVVFFGRQDTDTGRLLFKATAHITDVRGFSYNNERDANRNLLDTKVITVDFAKNKTVRAYADVDLGTTSVVGDVTLPNTPAGVTLCFRGEKKADPATTGPPVAPSYCDQAPANDKQGAFQLVQRPNPPVGLLDVFAYVRYATGAGADILSGRVDVDNIPKVVQGTFGDGTADVGGFSALGTNGFGINPTGIDRIGFHLATFDIKDTGYSSSALPFTPRFVTKAPFPAVTSAREHVGLAMAGDDFEVVGRIGELGTAVPGSDLVRVQIKDDNCIKPTGFGTRPDYPFYPADPVWTYTCIKGDFNSTGPAGADPLDIDVKVDKDGQRIALHDAGLSDLPQFFQFNLAKGPSQVPGSDPNRPLRSPCNPASASSQPADCAPPFVRLDTPGDSTLFGVAEIGALGDVADLNTVQPRSGDTANFDAAPGFDGCGWGSEWGGCTAGNATTGPFGLRAKVGQFEPPGGDSRKAIKAGIRLQIPASLTIDQINSWSGSSVSPDFYDASDLVFHAAFRNDSGAIVQKLGEAIAFINNFTSTEQILLTDATPGKRGFALPGDVAVGMYVRDAKGKGRKFIQVDGRVSTEMNVRARILPAGDDPEIDAKILHIPASRSTDAAGTPSFRLRAEIDGDKESPTATPPPSPPPDPPKKDDCSILFCVQTQVTLKTVDALLDFKPNSGDDPARLLEAVVRKDGIKNGAQLVGWKNVDGTGGSVEFKAAVDVLVQPINIFLHAGIPIIGSFDFILLSDLRAGLSVETNNFTLRQNLLHINASAVGGLGGSGLFSPCTGFNCLYTSYRIYVMHGLAFSIVGLLWGDPILLGIDYLPPSLPRIPGAPAALDVLDPTIAQIKFLDCPAGNFDPVQEVNVLHLNLPRDVVAWPLDDPHLITYGTLKPVFDFISDFAAPVFCFFGTGQDDIPLISGSAPGAADRVPGDPVGVPGHNVPDVTPSPAANSSSTPPPPPVLNVTGTVAMCGDHVVEKLNVASGGTLNVATVANSTPVAAGGPARCPAGKEGRLSIAAAGSDPSTPGPLVNIAGTVNGGSGALTFIGKDVTVAGAIHAGKGKVTLAAGNNLNVTGTVEADNVQDSAPFPFSLFAASGNSGGGHGGAGGIGSTGSAGGTFGNTGFDPSTTDGLVPTEFGLPGGSTGGPGRGGGALTLVAGNKITLSGGSTVSANGGPGTGAADVTCATGSPGGGGGAGGGIVLAAPEVSSGGTLAARGGNGGAGKGGGGGGGGGRIKIESPLFSGGFTTFRGSAGGEGCAAERDAQPGTSGTTPFDTLPTSSALPLSQFWNKGPLGINYSAAARVIPDGSDPPSDDFQVVLCGQFVAPDRPELDLLKEDGTAGQDQKADGLQLSMQSLIPPANSVTVAHPCGAFPPLFPAQPPNFPEIPDPRNPIVLKVQQVTNATRSNGTITPNFPQANGYWGVWTSVMKPLHDGDDCTDFLNVLLSSCEVEPMPAKPEVVFGFDNTKPSFVLGTDVTTTNDDGIKVTGSPKINVNITDAFDHMTRAFPQPDQEPFIPLSGVKDYVCLAVDLVHCKDGTNTTTVLVQNQEVTVQVFQFDQAGNFLNQEFELIVDTQPPTSDGRIDPVLPAGVVAKNNGWYSASPNFVLDTFSDPNTSNSKGAGFGKWVYHFDDGEEHECTANPCPLNSTTAALPGPGRHTLHWQAIDRVGNKEVTEHSLPVKIDGDFPLVAFSTAPGSPDGANKWFTGPTFGAISTFDQPPGGSGLRPQAGDPTPDPSKKFGVFYAIDSNAPATPYTAPFPMPAGSHFVCFQAIDIAGNTDGVHCSPPVQVDLAVPDVTINTTPSGPNGANGWYVTKPAVTVVTTDPVSGSTVDPAFDPDLSDLCTGRKAVPNAPGFKTPSGTCVSVDGRAYEPYFGATITIPEGLHSVRAFSVDVAGQRSPVREARYSVDLSHPVTAMRLVPPDPARAEWWRRVPKVVLRATDGEANAGVQRIEYAIDGGAPATYTGPFSVPSGVHTVTWQAFDVSGAANTEALHTASVSVDTSPALVKALEPNPVIWVLGGLLSPAQTQLKWRVKDDLSDKVQATVLVYNATGQVVRRIQESTPRTVTPGTAAEFSTAWDGKDQSLLGLVPAGVYYYRVVVVDEAGNVSQSGESKPIQIKVGLL